MMLSSGGESNVKNKCQKWPQKLMFKGFPFSKKILEIFSFSYMIFPLHPRSSCGKRFVWLGDSLQRLEGKKLRKKIQNGPKVGRILQIEKTFECFKFIISDFVDYKHKLLQVCLPIMIARSLKLRNVLTSTYQQGLPNLKDEIWSFITLVLLNILPWNFYQILPFIRYFDDICLIGIVQLQLMLWPEDAMTKESDELEIMSKIIFSTLLFIAS